MSTTGSPQTESESRDVRTGTRPLIGRVIGDKMTRTVTVLVERRVKHPLYKKYIRRSTKIHAHDERDECRVGDAVAIVQSRPLARTKAWRVKAIISRER